MKAFFKEALPIWGEGHLEELNSSLYFRASFKSQKAKIRIAANNFYRIYLDGKFFAYGPSRAAHDIYRVDSYDLSFPERKTHWVVIEVSGSNCNSFYALNRPPFLQCEILDKKGGVLACTGANFEVFLNATRIRKVTRFSYQRAFSESYCLSPSFNSFVLGLSSPYPSLKPLRVESKKFDERIVSYPVYKQVKYKPLEQGEAFIDEAKKPYEDRYQVLDYLKIFPKEEWEIDSNEIASKLSFRLAGTSFPVLGKMQFATFSNEVSLTGFLSLKVEAKEKSLLYIVFDEVDVRDKDNPSLIGISFCRNTTHNCLTYELEKGKYDLLSFEPYTMMHGRIVVIYGEVKVLSFGLVKYENPDASISFSFADKRIDSVLSAAKNTFKQNAVDLLTDCPSRERAGWLCDSYFSGQAEPLITGNNKEEKAFLDNYAHCSKENLPEGMIPMCYPADFPSKEFIPNWSLWYILELYEYKKRNGNCELIQESKANIEGILSYFARFENELGLLENLEGWVFVEWSKANDPEFIRGVNFPSNMTYADALEKAGDLLRREDLVRKGAELKKKIKELSFNGTFFVDNAVRDKDNRLALTNHTTETCQYYALYFGILTKEDNPSFFERMVKNFGEQRDEKSVYPDVYKSNVLIGAILRLRILVANGLSEEVFKETVKYFYKMSSLTGTLWEHDSVFASLNHCFTSHLFNIFLGANFGLDYIDRKKKFIHLHEGACLKEGWVKIPLEEGVLLLKAKEGRLTIKKPKGYSLFVGK